MRRGTRGAGNDPVIRAAYLRGQADALDLPVLDTTATDPAAGVAALGEHVARLRTAG